MDLIRFVTGCVAVEVTSAEIPGILVAAANADIPLYDTECISEFCVVCRIRKSHWSDLKALCERKGADIQLKRWMGLYWSVKSLIKRPFLLCGLLLLLAFHFTVPGRILFVSVEGNESVPDNRILDCAAEFGLRFGADRRELRSEQLKNQLLQAIPELRWAGVNTRGCVAVISVSERTESAAQQADPGGIRSIVAGRDGVILSVTATAGNLQCREGQAVKEGQILISGYTDCGISIRGEQAEGEIFAQTNRTLSVIMPSGVRYGAGDGGVLRNFSVIFGKKRINLWKDSGIWDGVYDRIYEEYYITLPGGFRLPVCIAIESVYALSGNATEADTLPIQAVLQSCAESYLRQDMVAGTVLHRSETVTQTDGCWCLDGRYVCTEMIGKVRQEQIGEYDGKDS